MKYLLIHMASHVKRARHVVLRVVAAVVLVAAFALAREARAAVGEDKAGPLMGNFKLGPAVSFGGDFGGPRGGCLGCFGFNDTQFAMELEIAYALDRGNKAAYIGFNPQFQFGFGTIINLTGTFQYDIQIAASKVRGLYIYPKINVGAAIYPNNPYYYGINGCFGCTSAAFTLQPELGVKFNIFKNFHVLGEPLSFPIYIGGITFAQWRFWLGCGFDV